MSGLYGMTTTYLKEYKVVIRGQSLQAPELVQSRSLLEGGP
jgi:hypothetical protein